MDLPSTIVAAQLPFENWHENIRNMMITVYITDMDKRHVFAAVREAYSKNNPPVSSMVEVRRLVMEELILEMDGVAVLG